jgi:hypothetical protein
MSCAFWKSAHEQDFVCRRRPVDCDYLPKEWRNAFAELWRAPRRNGAPRQHDCNRLGERRSALAANDKRRLAGDRSLSGEDGADRFDQLGERQMRRRNLSQRPVAAGRAIGQATVGWFERDCGGDRFFVTSGVIVFANRWMRSDSADVIAANILAANILAANILAAQRRVMPVADRNEHPFGQ